MSEPRQVFHRNAVNIKGGPTAGFVVTVVLSLMMIGKTALGLLPVLNPIGDIVHVASSFVGFLLPAPFRWVGHFFIGTIAWGITYALMEPFLPGSAVIKGLIFGTIAWLTMMILFMPVAGHGLFGRTLGLPAVIATLFLHLVYGAVLGSTGKVSLPWPGSCRVGC